MKHALFLLVATLATVSWSFLDTPEDRKAFAEVLDKDPKSRAFLEEILANAEGKDLKDLGVLNYNCPGLMGPSQTVPTSAHSVRPADIKIIGALGDSLTAGNGAGATNLGQVFTEYRGLTFLMGGDLDLDTHATIPNILKKYNSKIYGWSKGTGDVNSVNTMLNAAVPGAQSYNLTTQAVDLVNKIQTHPQINVANDWKLINIFIGGNDMCSFCEDGTTSNTHSAFNFANNIAKAVKILYDNLPRTIVSITGMFQMQILRQADAGQDACIILHQYECKCESNGNFTNAQMQAASQAYLAAEMELQTNGTFDVRDDFTLVVQPFLRDVDKPPFKPDGSVDHEFFAPDCFHFSKYGHAMAAKGLWNNLVQPVGFKVTNYNLSDPTVALACPDPNCPFIRTTKNSGNCAAFFTSEK